MLTGPREGGEDDEEEAFKVNACLFIKHNSGMFINNQQMR
jgi:hypothetical protein